MLQKLRENQSVRKPAQYFLSVQPAACGTTSYMRHNYGNTVVYNVFLTREGSPAWWKKGIVSSQGQGFEVDIPEKISKTLPHFRHHGTKILRVCVLIDEQTSTAVVESYFRYSSPESDALKQIAKLAIVEHLKENGTYWIIPLKEFLGAEKDFENYSKIPIYKYTMLLEKLVRHPEHALGSIKLFCEGPI